MALRDVCMNGDASTLVDVLRVLWYVQSESPNPMRLNGRHPSGMTLASSDLKTHPLATSIKSLHGSLYASPLTTTTHPAAMAAPRTALTALARARPALASPATRSAFAATFTTSIRRPATTEGPPPQGFRLPTTRLNAKKESVFDQAGNYFLLTEMMRGMYVVLEQFFRPPYVVPYYTMLRQKKAC